MMSHYHPGQSLPKLALISGGGQVPIEIADYLKTSGRAYSVIRLLGLADEALRAHPGHDIEIGNFAQLFQILMSEACLHVCMVGYVQRPDFETLKSDHGGKAHLPSIEKAGRGGDDSLLRQVAKVFEAQGFVIEGAHQANPQLLLGQGLMAGPEPLAQDFEDMATSVRMAQGIGALDIGQAVVVAKGVTLCVEAQEGTQAMLARVQSLQPALRGTKDQPLGVLAKWPKPIQDLRLDMPTIGVQTLEDMSKAGLRGLVGQAGALLIVDKPAVFARAHELGLFIYGYDDSQISQT